MKRILAIIFSVLAFMVTAGADTYIRYKVRADSPGLPAEEETNEQWVGDGRFAYLRPDLSTVIDLKKNTVLVIFHERRQFLETNLPLDPVKLLPPEYAQFAGLARITASVRPTGEKRMIGKWNCDGYELRLTLMMMPVLFTVWTSADVPIDMASYADLLARSQQGVLLLDGASLQEMAEIKGLWISFDMNVDFMELKKHVSCEAVEVSRKRAPSSVFLAPQGYARIDTLPLKVR